MPTIRAEIVRNHKDLATGLMERKHLPKNAGMLFDFGSDQELSFWMKNTYLPLQIAFINSKGVVKHIASMAPLSTRSVRSPFNCRYALEVNDGWFDENNIRTGATVVVPEASVETQPNAGEPSDPSNQSEPAFGNETLNPEETEQPTSPELVIEQSFKDVLTAANDYSVSVVLEYLTKEENALPPKTISPPYIFGDTENGDVNGLVTVWDEQESSYKSFIVDNILGIKDLNGNPIKNSAQIEELAKGIPNKVIDEMSAKGKLPQQK
jgi:uncharacterized protein